MKNVITSILITGFIGYGAVLGAAQEQARLTQERRQDKQRIARLSADELRYELDFRWKKLQAAHAGFPIEKLFQCCANWASGYVGGKGGGLHTTDYIVNLRKMVSPARMVFTKRDEFLQTGGRGEIPASYLSELGKYPDSARKYFECVYDLTIDTEIATFGHIYKLTPQEEADIKAKAQADPLTPKIKVQTPDEFKKGAPSTAPKPSNGAIEEKFTIADFNHKSDYQDIIKVHEAFDDTTLRYLRINDRQYISAEVDEWFPSPEKQQKEALAGKIIDAKVLRSVESGKLIGGVSCLIESSDHKKDCGIPYIFINKDFQGKGFGKKLMQAAIDFFASKGCGKVTLEVVSDNPAKNLYTNMGFVLDMEGLGNYYMHKDLKKAE